MIVSAAGTTESYRRRCVSVVPNGTDSNGRVRNPALKRRAIFIVPETHSMKIEASSGKATPNRRTGSDVFLLLGVALLLDFIGFCNVPARVDVTHNSAAYIRGTGLEPRGSQKKKGRFALPSFRLVGFVLIREGPVPPRRPRAHLPARRPPWRTTRLELRSRPPLLPPRGAAGRPHECSPLWSC